MHLTEKENETLAVRKARNGDGIFAKKTFLPEEIIFQVTGDFVTCDEDDEMDDEERANTYRYDGDLYISPIGRIANFLNHSCEPNSKLVKKDNKLFVVAVMEISPNDEVLLDYSTMLSSDDVWEMTCNCGEENCRGTVGQFGSLPKELQKKYRKAGMVPDYINV